MLIETFVIKISPAYVAFDSLFDEPRMVCLEEARQYNTHKEAFEKLNEISEEYASEFRGKLCQIESYYQIVRK